MWHERGKRNTWRLLMEREEVIDGKARKRPLGRPRHR
jgi:hypothetical protein